MHQQFSRYIYSAIKTLLGKLILILHKTSQQFKVSQIFIIGILQGIQTELQLESNNSAQTLHWTDSKNFLSLKIQ